MEAVLVFTLFLLYFNTVQAGCPNLWTSYKGSCYYLFQDREQWAQANFICQSRGAHLVTIETRDENTVVENLARNNQVVQGDMWIGASDMMVEGQWTWAGHKESMTFTDWGPTEPNGGHNENCALLSRKGNFRWIDAACDNLAHFMCETEET